MSAAPTLWRTALGWFARKARLVLLLLAVFLGVFAGHLATSGVGIGWVTAIALSGLLLLGLGWALVGFWLKVFRETGGRDG